MIVEDSSCAPPRVWSAGSGGEFAKINRPIAGPRSGRTTIFLVNVISIF